MNTHQLAILSRRADVAPVARRGGATFFDVQSGQILGYVATVLILLLPSSNDATRNPPYAF
jgi:hypothetical protein